MIELYPYLGLFFASFLAATIVPFSSEILLGTMLAGDFSPTATLLSACTGNVLGAVTNYAVGAFGSYFVLEKIFRVSKAEMDKSMERFRRYGTASLLLAWVPIIGDPLTVAAGVLKINFWLFLFLVGVGKCARYFFIAWAVLPA